MGGHRHTSPLNSHTRDSLWSRNARRSGPMSMLSVSKVALQQTGGSQVLLQGCQAGVADWAHLRSTVCSAGESPLNTDSHKAQVSPPKRLNAAGRQHPSSVCVCSIGSLISTAAAPARCRHSLPEDAAQVAVLAHGQVIFA